MRHKIIVRTFPLLLVASSLLSLPLFAQDPDAPSVAEAARRTREQKKAAAKPANVVTDDTLHPADASGTPSVSQPGQPSNVSGANNGMASGQSTSAATPEDVEEKKKELDSLKKEIAEKQSEVDLAQRELTLENDSFYSKADFARDKDGKSKLDSMQSDLNAKKDELAQLKAKLADLGGVEEPKTPATSAPPPKP
jgi:predicted RNase H-like nuclease (RuvC/YqgF family)